ncbi:MAG: DUF2269 family protein [Candidatus Limnocylindria bacterium]
MPDLVPWFLVLHVLGAIIAFGPVFSFTVIRDLGRADPMHGNFATRVSAAISDRRVIPVALTMPVTGIGLIWSVGIDPFAREARWLLLGITLYLIALTYSLTIQKSAVGRIISLTASPPPPAAPGSAPSGPPPALMDAIRTVQRGGMLLLGLITVIVFLMVVKPDFGF